MILELKSRNLDGTLFVDATIQVHDLTNRIVRITWPAHTTATGLPSDWDWLDGADFDLDLADTISRQLARYAVHLSSVGQAFSLPR